MPRTTLTPPVPAPSSQPPSEKKKFRFEVPAPQLVDIFAKNFREGFGGQMADWEQTFRDQAQGKSNEDINRLVSDIFTRAQRGENPATFQPSIPLPAALGPTVAIPTAPLVPQAPTQQHKPFIFTPSGKPDELIQLQNMVDKLFPEASEALKAIPEATRFASIVDGLKQLVATEQAESKQKYQAEVDKLFEAAKQSLRTKVDKLSPELSKEDFDEVVKNIVAEANKDFQAKANGLPPPQDNLLEHLKAQGRTPETEYLLRNVFGAGESEISQLFGGPGLEDMVDKLMPGTTPDELQATIKTNFQGFTNWLRDVGPANGQTAEERQKDKVTLLKMLGVADAEIRNLMSEGRPEQVSLLHKVNEVRKLIDTTISAAFTPQAFVEAIKAAIRVVKGQEFPDAKSEQEAAGRLVASMVGFYDPKDIAAAGDDPIQIALLMLPLAGGGAIEGRGALKAGAKIGISEAEQAARASSQKVAKSVSERLAENVAVKGAGEAGAIGPEFTTEAFAKGRVVHPTSGKDLLAFDETIASVKTELGQAERAGLQGNVEKLTAELSDFETRREELLITLMREQGDLDNFQTIERRLAELTSKRADLREVSATSELKQYSAAVIKIGKNRGELISDQAFIKKYGQGYDEVAQNLGYEERAGVSNKMSDELFKSDLRAAFGEGKESKQIGQDIISLKAQRANILAKYEPKIAKTSGPGGQVGMGIGEKPPQGQLLPEFLGRGEAAPLANVEAIAARQSRAAEVARGQTILPEATTGLSKAELIAKRDELLSQIPRQETGQELLHKEKFTAIRDEIADLDGQIRASDIVAKEPVEQTGAAIAYQKVVNEGVPIAERKPPPLPKEVPPTKKPPKDPVKSAEQPYHSEPPSVEPLKLGNVIGLRLIRPGLTRDQTFKNSIRSMFSKLSGKVGARPLILEEQFATPAMTERARVTQNIDSVAGILSEKHGVAVGKVFKFDKKGRITDLSGVIPEIGAPTIQDVAARLPLYTERLTLEQLATLKALRGDVKQYGDLLAEMGVEVRTRGDIMEGGFYLPRGRAGLEGAEEPVKVFGVGRGGGKKGFQKPAVFDSMAEGIDAGFEYSSLADSLGAYAKDAGTKALNAHISNYFKTLTDDTGRLFGETPKMRMLRQNPEIAQRVDDAKALLDKLKSNIGALTQRQIDVIDLWQHDPEFGDIGTLLEGLETMRGGQPPASLRGLKTLFSEVKAELRALKPDYDNAMRRAQVTPRDQGVMSLPLDLQGRTFPNEMANAVNNILRKEGALTGKGSETSAIINIANGTYAMIHATGDMSFSFITGLLSLYDRSAQWGKMMKYQTRALFSEKVSGAFLLDFNKTETAAGRLTAEEWAKTGSRGSRFGGPGGFMESAGVSDKLSKIPIVKQTNRAFSTAGDTLRLSVQRDELISQMTKGRTLEEIRASGDLDRITDFANVLTGWSPKDAGGSIGRTLLFAPKWLQSRLEIVTLAAKGLRPGAPLDQALARNAILKLVAYGTIITVAANEALDNDTDFRLIVDGKRNPKFMRIKFGGEYRSVFGPWDSLVGMITNVGTGKPLHALRSMGSGVVATSFDLISGRDFNFNQVGSQPFDPKLLMEWIARSSLPFSAGNLPEGIAKIREGEVITGVIDIVSRMGGIKSFPERDFKTNRQQLGLPMSDNPSLYSTENPNYTYDKYASDTLEGPDMTNPKEVIGNKDYPPDVQAIVQAREFKKELDKFPNRKLSSVNIDPMKDGKPTDTFKEFHTQWLHQQELVAAGDKAEYTDKKGAKHKGDDAVKAFVNDFPKSEQGNMTQRQFVLMTQYAQISDSKRKAEFLKANPELSLNPYQDWLKSHPNENALIALTHQGTPLLTKEAYTKFKALLQQFDVPDAGVPEQSLPPEGSIDDYFKYQDMVAEGTEGSWEAKLMLTKDTELLKFLGRTPIDTPIASLELKVKNRVNFDKLDSFSDKDSPAYIADEKKRAEAVKKFRTANPEFVDDKRRIEAIEKWDDETPTPEGIIGNHVEYGRLIDRDDTAASSAEAMLYRVDNPAYDQWRQDTSLWGDQALTPLDRSRVASWRIDVKYRKEDSEYQAILDKFEGREESTAAKAYLAKNEDYRMDRRRRQAMSLTNPKTHEKFPGEQVESFVLYNELPTKGFRQERFLIDNPDFAKAMHEIVGRDIRPKEEIPDVKFDNIYDQWQEEFDIFEGLSDSTSNSYVEDVKKREQARNSILFHNGKYTEFGLANLRREAYGKFIPEKHIENYVGYYTILGQGKPELGLGEKDPGWYEDDWFLINHLDYYREVYLLTHKREDFSKVPTPQVFAKYKKYLALPSLTQKKQYRAANSDLDEWGQDALGWESIEDQRVRAGLSSSDRVAQDVAKELEKIRSLKRKRRR